MKRYLYLMRHAKAEDGFGKSDFERDLHAKGHKRLVKAVDYCKQQRVGADIVLASAAHRTTQTAEIMIRDMGWSPDILHLDKNLYLCSVGSVLDQLYALDDSVQHAWIVGHNPCISDVAYTLNHKVSHWLPTAGIVALRFRANSWQSVFEAKNKCLFTFLGK